MLTVNKIVQANRGESLQSTNRTTETVERRAFSANFQVQGSAAPIAKTYTILKKKRQKRKLETNGVISPFTNKCFLSKEEVTKLGEASKV